jgi:hypothetical protein
MARLRPSGYPAVHSIAQKAQQKERNLERENCELDKDRNRHYFIRNVFFFCGCACWRHCSIYPYIRVISSWRYSHYFVVFISLSSNMPSKSSVAWVRERSIPTERPPLVGELSANFWG